MKSKRGFVLRGRASQQLRQVCVLSGCDYLPSFEHMGLRTALKLVKKHREASRAVRMCRLEGWAVPADYEARFRQAMLTFDHQQVFDPSTDTARPLTPIPETTTWERDFAPFLSAFAPHRHTSRQQQAASSKRDAFTHKQ